MGPETADDAAVYCLTDEIALVQTVDFFTPVVDDPYTFGAIAAANSLSDAYAMGARPIMALNVVGFPRDDADVPLSILREILRGGGDKAKEAGIQILGGHTIDDLEPKYGLAVSAVVHPKRVWRNVGAQPGDRLILTKAIGTGIVTTGIRAEKAAPEDVAATIESMATLNRTAAETAIDLGVTVRACTDVTGFGLFGHLSEMLGAADVGIRLDANAVPVLGGTRDLAERGFIPGGSRRNRDAVAEHADFGTLSDTDQLVLCDAQTSGGLLFAVPPAEADGLVDALRAAGVAAATVIGTFTESERGRIVVETR